MVIRQLDTLCHCNLYVKNTALKEVLEMRLSHKVACRFNSC